jgi:hypothetical protein
MFHGDQRQFWQHVQYGGRIAFLALSSASAKVDPFD